MPKRGKGWGVFSPEYISGIFAEIRVKGRLWIVIFGCSLKVQFRELLSSKLQHSE